MAPRTLRIGTAGWTIPLAQAGLAPGSGSHLERYARTLTCAELNTTFYRSHRPATWQRWAASTPEGFRFSVKFPKTITHGAKLAVAPTTLDPFFAEIAALGDRLGPILIQLPPSLAFDDCPAAEFFEAIRERTSGPVALEPRHASWFAAAADDLLIHHRISLVAADPSRNPNAAQDIPPEPAGWRPFAYYRLHGSPRTYYSSYSDAWLAALVKSMLALPAAAEAWIIFDNTAAGQAFANALTLQDLCSSGMGGAQHKRAKPKPRP